MPQGKIDFMNQTAVNELLGLQENIRNAHEMTGSISLDRAVALSMIEQVFTARDRAGKRWEEEILTEKEVLLPTLEKLLRLVHKAAENWYPVQICQMEGGYVVGFGSEMRGTRVFASTLEEAISRAYESEFFGGQL